MKETIDVLTERAKKHLKEAVEYQTEADNATLEAGKALQKLKARITNKGSDEGKEWGHSWPKFVTDKLKGECSYPHAQRLIGFADSKNPEAAMAEYRRQDAAKKRERRASQTSENAVAAEPRTDPPATSDDAEQNQNDADAVDSAQQRGAVARHASADDHCEQIAAVGQVPPESRRKSQGKPAAEAEDEWSPTPGGYAHAPVHRQVGLLLYLWGQARPKTRKLFCERVGLQEVAAGQDAGEGSPSVRIQRVLGETAPSSGLRQ